MTNGLWRRHYVNHCEPCDKRSCSSKEGAKEVAKKVDRAMRAYRCPASPNLWHVGHLPTRVRRGEVTRDEIYRRGAA